MNLLFGSDFHGNEQAFLRFAELLSDNQYSAGILGGDLMNAMDDKEQFRNKEIKMKQILNSSRKPVLFVMGNGDGNAGINWRDEGYLKNISNKREILDGQAFVGYQYSNPLSGSPFEKTEIEQDEDMHSLSKLIDADTILVTHAPAFGILDWRMRDGEGMNMGSRMIAKLMQKNNPKLHLHGHAHQSTGIDGSSINGAYFENHKFVCLNHAHKIYEFIE